ncbi:CrcB family protein [Nocardioides sp. TF02-7]|uniref:CrcB family protein n=1 Tax=Nocardioides sp. TF02-7 TaxID=2917724 RepID=UPI001F060703|nr:CrcB family protein [Nocardioides sp. TF02-7]UMG91061.1 CrcB family protein [Nocardioides sp. TF02-7]
MTVRPRLLLAVAAGGAAGAVLRHLAGEAAPDGTGFPWTTFAVNVAGSALLAALSLLRPVRRSATWAAGLGPGLLGGFTTLSATSEQARRLLADGDAVLAGGTCSARSAPASSPSPSSGRSLPPPTREEAR